MDPPHDRESYVTTRPILPISRKLVRYILITILFVPLLVLYTAIRFFMLPAALYVWALGIPLRIHLWFVVFEIVRRARSGHVVIGSRHHHGWGFVLSRIKRRLTPRRLDEARFRDIGSVTLPYLHMEMDVSIRRGRQESEQRPQDRPPDGLEAAGRPVRRPPGPPLREMAAAVPLDKDEPSYHAH